MGVDLGLERIATAASLLSIVMESPENAAVLSG
jgi:hypothetical protein